MKDWRLTKNPLTQKYEKAEWIPDHFARGIYGVKFADGTVYNPDKVALKIRTEVW